MKEAIKQFIRRNSEILTIPLALAVWFIFLKFSEKYGFSTYDTGIFQKLIFAFIAILVINGLSWWLLGINQPFLRKFLDSENREKWQSISVTDRLKYSFLFYLLYFVALTVIVAMT